ncbi:class I SAM-dependent methyltransferase [Chloroflexota bacterium]
MASSFNPKIYWIEQGNTYIYEHPPEGERGEKLILDTLAKIDFQSLLEMGCGYGRYLKCIAERFPQVRLTGVDISPTQIDEAKRYLINYPQIQLEETDGLHLPYSDKCFDISFTYGCMIHVPQRYVQSFFKEICRVTRRKGLFLESSQIKRLAIKRMLIPAVVWYSHDYDTLFRHFQRPYQIVKEWEFTNVIERLYLVDFTSDGK